ncbi:MAG: hypothetical protein JWN68_3732, partial [Nocardioides sp.]|nr:hypothetical protein [Nocardioides sp.]
MSTPPSLETLPRLEKTAIPGLVV